MEREHRIVVGRVREATRRVLVVDPDTAFADKVGTLLSSYGYEVETVQNIRQAVAAVGAKDFSCVIVDEDLAEMKGYDAVPLLKAISPEPPVIVTAARNSQEQEARIRQQDIFYYYVKGIDIGELTMAVDDALVSRLGRRREPSGGKR